jgi:hypothetical protein
MAKLIKSIHDLITLATNKGIAGYYSDTQVDDAIDQGQMLLFRQLLQKFPRDKRVRNDLLPFEVKANVTITSKIGSLPSDFEHEIEAWYTAASVDYPVQFVESGFYKTRIRDVVDPPSSTNIFGSIYYDSGKKIEVSSQLTPIVLLYFKRPTKPVFATTLTYTFTVTSASATVGATYTNNGNTFTVVATISGAVTLVCTSQGAPASSGTLTKASGTGDATITFSSVTATTQYVYDDALSTDVLWSSTVHDILVENTLAILGLNIRDFQVIRSGQKSEPKELSL